LERNPSNGRRRSYSYADERLAGCSPQLEIGAEIEF
jgi:hypothetical protein